MGPFADTYDVDEPYLNFRVPLPDPPIEPGTAAPLVIDMQYADASLDAGIFALKRGRGLTAGLDYFAARMKEIVAVNQELIRSRRAVGIDVIYSRIQSMSPDASCTGSSRRSETPPGSSSASTSTRPPTFLDGPNSGASEHPARRATR